MNKCIFIWLLKHTKTWTKWIALECQQNFIHGKQKYNNNNKKKHCFSVLHDINVSSVNHVWSRVIKMYFEDYQSNHENSKKMLMNKKLITHYFRNVRKNYFFINSCFSKGVLNECFNNNILSTIQRRTWLLFLKSVIAQC